MTGSRRVATVVMLVGIAVLAACTSTRSGTTAGGKPVPLDVTGVRTVSLPAVRPPAYHGLDPYPSAAAVTGAGRVLVASHGLPGSSTSTIQASDDDGGTWSVAWSGPETGIFDLAASGDDVIAAANTVAPMANPADSQPVLLRSQDDGGHWTEIHPQLPPAVGSEAGRWGGLQIEVVSGLDLWAGPDPDAQDEDFELLHSVDGGAHWSDVVLAGGTPSGGVAFVSATRGFAAGAGSVDGLKCAGGIWSTSDAGRSWQLVAGSCGGAPLYGVSFPSPEVGFVTGGYSPITDNSPASVVMRSTDGGNHWSTVYSASPGSPAHPSAAPLTEVSFPSVEAGYAEEGGCSPGANGPCGGDLLVSHDGGRHWTDTGHRGTFLATRENGQVWVGGGIASIVAWHSSDAGSSWTPVGDVHLVTVSDLLIGGSTLWANWDNEEFRSDDNGVTWKPVPATISQMETAKELSLVAVGPGGLVVLGNYGIDYAWVSHDGGVSGTDVALPGLGTAGGSAIAVADASHVLVSGQANVCSVGGPAPKGSSPVIASTDAGRHWRLVARLPLTVTFLGYGSSGAVASGPGPAVKGQGGCADRIALSADGGSHWRLWSDPKGLACGSARAGGEVMVLGCVRTPPAIPGHTIELVSTNEGRSWHGISLSGGTPYYQPELAVSGNGNLWAYGAPGVLWKSTDGGLRWQAVLTNFPVAP